MEFVPAPSAFPERLLRVDPASCREMGQKAGETVPGYVRMSARRKPLAFHPNIHET
jgi:hypothetical protein